MEASFRAAPIALCLLTLSACAWAQQDVPTPLPAVAPAVPAAAPDEEPVVETTRRAVRTTFEWLARGVDSWFGDTPFESGGGEVSNGQASLSFLQRERQAADVNLRFSARFRLPNVEKRNAYLFLGRDNVREVVTDKPDPASRQQRALATDRADQSFFAGLGVTLRDLVDLRVGIRGPLKPYAQARYRKPWELSEVDHLEFRQTFFWTRDDHAGSTTTLGYQRTLSPTLAARWYNQATVTERKRDFEWTSVLGGYRVMGPQRLLSLEAVLTGVQNSGVGVSEYGLRVKWEQPIHEERLIGEFVVGHFWPRADPASPRTRAWAVGAGLRMAF